MNGENESRSIGNSGPLWDENFARIFLEAQGIGLIILDSNGRFVHTNLAFAQMVGRPPAELVSVSLFDMTHPDDHEQLQRIIILPPGQSCIQDGRILTQDGQLRWLNYHVQAKLDSGTEPLMHFYAAVQDITERKQAELATHQSETRYRQLFENALMGIFRSTPDGRFLEVNPALVRMLGYDSAADVLALKLPEDLYVDPSQRAQIQEIYDPQGVAEDVKAVWKHKDGTQIVVRIHSRVIRDDQQNVQYYEGMVQDVTRHHEAEQELLQEKALIDSISDSLPGLLVVYNQEGRRLRWNKNVELVTGYTKEELPVLPPMALMAKSKHPFLAAKMREVLVQGNTTFETHLVTKNGRTIPHFFSGHRILLDGEPAIIGLGIDISDRVEAEEKLRQSEANLQAIFNNTLQAFVLFDVNRRVLAANPRANNWARQILGKPLQGGQNADDLFAMFNIDAFQQAFAEAVQGVTTVRQHKITVANRDAWFETSYNPVITDTEEVVGVSMSVLNITEQKKNEEALLQGEARFRAIVEDQVDMIMRAKVDGTLTYVNEAYARAGNSTPEEMVGQNFLSFLGEEERKIVQGKFSRLTPDNPVEIDEHQEVLPDGSVVWLHWADRGIFNSQGQLIEVQAVGTDITHRIEAEEELRRSETRLQQIIDTVPEGVLLLDADYRVMLANPLAEQFLTLLAPDWENGRLAYLGNQPLNKLLTSPPKGLWHDIVLHNQAFEAIARPVETDYQNTGWVLLIRDVTQERDIQQQAQRQERLAAVGQLAAGIAHDFNNILAVITLYAQLILQTVKLPPQSKEKVITIENQAQRASDLIQQVLDFSRQSVMERQPLQLLPIMKELVRLLKRTLPEHIQIKLDHTEEDFFVLADPSRIQQAMMNLAVNARDAMPAGGHIDIRLAHLQIEPAEQPPVQDMPPGKWIQIEVADSGSGIAPADLSHIFEPFFTTKEVGQGTGLGLAQVYGIIQQHEGYIDITTELNQGTTFSIYLPPLATGEAALVTPDRGALQHGQGQTVLLVEDNATARKALADSLTLLNYKVLEAANAREALAILKTKSDEIALVLSDVVMPEMGGIALFHAMQQQNLSIPVALLTGHPLGKDMKTLQKLGLAGWLPKPTVLETLSQLLSRVLA